MQIQLSRTSLSKIVISSLRDIIVILIKLASFSNQPDQKYCQINQTQNIAKSTRPKILLNQPDLKYCQINQTPNIAKSTRPKILPNQPDPKYCQANQTQNIAKLIKTENF